MAIIQDYGFGDILSDNVDVIIKVIGQYIQKFPFDSSKEKNSNIRALHNALKDRFAINFYYTIYLRAYARDRLYRLHISTIDQISAS